MLDDDSENGSALRESAQRRLERQRRIENISRFVADENKLSRRFDSKREASQSDVNCRIAVLFVSALDEIVDGDGELRRRSERIRVVAKVKNATGSADIRIGESDETVAIRRRVGADSGGDEISFELVYHFFDPIVLRLHGTRFVDDENDVGRSAEDRARAQRADGEDAQFSAVDNVRAANGATPFKKNNK